jgi:hypothetical protein
MQPTNHFRWLNIVPVVTAEAVKARQALTGESLVEAQQALSSNVTRLELQQWWVEHNPRDKAPTTSKGEWRPLQMSTTNASAPPDKPGRIWALFSVSKEFEANEKLEAWWPEKPTLDQLVELLPFLGLDPAGPVMRLHERNEVQDEDNMTYWLDLLPAGKVRV